VPGRRRPDKAASEAGDPQGAVPGAGAVRGAGAVYGALDLGTNNCRLLVARPAARGFQIVDAFSRIVRLGEGLGEAGALSEAAMARTISALHICARKMRRKGVARARSIATEACRQAENCDQFLDRVAAETGITFEVISRREEAALALSGCVPLLDDDARRALVFDIGGGSTELMWLDNQASGGPRAIDILSLPFGVVSLAEEHGRDALSPEALEAIVERIDADLAPFENKHAITAEIAAGRVHVLGTSGTVTTMGAIYLDLARYDRARVDGLSIRYESIDAICKNLVSLDVEALHNHPCIGEGRADLMVMGCAILDAICRRWPVGRLRIADRGIREGLLLGMMAADGSVRGPVPPSAPQAARDAPPRP